MGKISRYKKQKGGEEDECFIGTGEIDCLKLSASSR